MRLDRYLSESTDLSRSQARRVIADGEITINGEVVNKPAVIVAPEDVVCWGEEELTPVGLRYLMLHKPLGYECSLRSSVHPSVLDLIEIEKHERLRIVGRLDVDTSGLLLITDDGQWSHAITSPRSQCEKAYLATLAEPLIADAELRLEQGLLLEGDEKPTLPAKLERVSEFQARLMIREGRYHQVRRMFAALGNHVVALHRERIGSVQLDADLAPGESRFLRPEEVQALGPVTALDS